jgi:Ca2+/Na+ antiporter
MLAQDIPIMIGVAAAFILTLILFRKIPRPVGALFVLAYVGYMILLTIQSLQG